MSALKVGQDLECLTVSMRKGRLIHKQDSEMNGSVLIEELRNGIGGETIRRMRFGSNLELEQSEVRLVRGTNGEGLMADSSYMPYECLQGMLVAFGLRDESFPLWNQNDGPQPPPRRTAPRGDGAKDSEEASARRDVVIVGLAGGMLPRFLQAHFAVHVTCVEFDPVVCQLAQEYLGLRGSPNLSVHTAEGMDFIRNSESGSWDIVIIDVNAPCSGQALEAPPADFVAPSSLVHIARCTAPGGIAIINLLCSDPNLFDLILKRIQRAFHGTVCTLRDVGEDADENCVVFARNLDDDQWPPSNEVVAQRLQDLEEAVPQMKPFRLPQRVLTQLNRSSLYG